MAEQHSLDLDRRDVFTAADDHVLEPVPNLDETIRVHHRGVPRVEPAALERTFGRLGIAVIARHHDIASRDYLADRGTIARHVPARFVHDPQLARCDQLYALSSLDPRPVGRRELGVLRPGLADSDEGRCLGETINLRYDNAQLIIHPPG